MHPRKKTESLTAAVVADGASTASQHEQIVSASNIEKIFPNVRANFKQKIATILQLRWSRKELCTNTEFLFPVLQGKKESDFSPITVRLRCFDLAEAVLIAEMIESTLEQTYQIKSRISTQLYPVIFQYIENADSDNMYVILRYRLDECIKMLEDKAFIFDERIVAIFQDPKKNYYSLSVTSEYKPAIQFLPAMYRMDNTSHLLQEIVDAVLHESQPETAPPIVDNMRILVMTSIGLGAGNYMHAVRVIKQLAEKMPQCQIDWILADYDLSVPAVDVLPSNITLHRSRMLYQQFPLIQYLSLQVDAVIGLPNDFLNGLQKCFYKTQMLLSNSCPYIVIKEYNMQARDDELAQDRLSDIILYTGIHQGQTRNSLGIVKPDVMTFPMERRMKREILQHDSACASIFADHPDASLYFSYIYAPLPDVGNTNILGLQNRDVLAFFIQYAKRRQEDHIKIVLSIRVEEVQKAIELYPGVFAHCTLQLHSQKAPVQTILNHGALTIQVYDSFPFSNKVFRGLSDYASSCNTPVVMTGDQSFFELFFVQNDSSPVVLYQLLKHKTALFSAIQQMAKSYDANNVEALLLKLENRIDSEESLIALSDQVFTNYASLQSEFQVLKAHITQQPDMVDTLVSALPAVITRYRTFLLDDRKKEIAVLSLADIFDMFVEDEIPLDSFVEVLNLFDTQVNPAFCVSSLITEYCANSSLLTSFIRVKNPKRFTNIFIHLIQLNENILRLPMDNNRLSETFIERMLENKKSYDAVYSWLSENKTALLRSLEEEFSFLKAVQKNVRRFLKKSNFQKILALLQEQSIPDVAKILIYNDQQLFEALMTCLPSPEVFAIWMFFIQKDKRVLDIDVGSENELSLLRFFCNTPTQYRDILRDILNQYEDSMSEEQLSLVNRAINSQQPMEPLCVTSRIPAIDSQWVARQSLKKPIKPLKKDKPHGFFGNFIPVFQKNNNKPNTPSPLGKFVESAASWTEEKQVATFSGIYLERDGEVLHHVDEEEPGLITSAQLAVSAFQSEAVGNPFMIDNITNTDKAEEDEASNAMVEKQDSFPLKRKSENFMRDACERGRVKKGVLADRQALSSEASTEENSIDDHRCHKKGL